MYKGEFRKEKEDNRTIYMNTYVDKYMYVKLDIIYKYTYIYISIQLQIDTLVWKNRIQVNEKWILALYKI